MQIIKRMLTASLAFVLAAVLAVPVLASTEAKVTRLRMNRSAMDMVINDTKTLSVKVYPEGMTDTITWSVGNPKVATVDQSGNVTAVAVGSTTVTAASSNDKTARCTVTVFRKEQEEEVKSVDLYPTTLTVRVGQTRMLTSFVTLTRNNGILDDENDVVDWVSSDTDVAEVDYEGIVTGIAPGTATVTATSENGVTGSCIIKVTGTRITGNAESVPNTTQPNSSELLSSAAAKTVVEEVANATAKGKVGTAVFTDKSSLSPTVAGAAAYTAETLGRTVQLKFTTTDGDKKTQGFLILDPAKVTESTGNIGTLVSLDSKTAASATKNFESHYSGRLEVIDCSHWGAFDQPVTVGAKANLEGMNKENLRFYLYNSENNRFDPLEATYRIDDSGYLRITTGTGGILIVSDGPLTKK